MKRKPLSHAVANSGRQAGSDAWAAASHAPVIDLINSDEENDLTRPPKVRRVEGHNRSDFSRRPNVSHPSASSQARNYRTEERNDEDNANEVIDLTQSAAGAAGAVELYGTLKARIVGIRYYSGCATQGETVLCRREPSNPYDRNAIRIDNVLLNQIGHIPRQIAAKLAKYMDEKLLFPEARISGPPSEWDIPLDVELYGPSDSTQAEQIKARMQGDKLPVDALTRRTKEAAKATKAQEKARLAQLKAAARQAARRGAQEVFSPQWAGSSSQPITVEEDLQDIMEQSQRFNPREIGEVAEKFGVDEESLQQLPLADQPKNLTTTLLPYQRQGLAWMLSKENPALPAENSDEVVQLWKRSGPQKWTNIATNFSVKNSPPRLARGGVLADDMGLGKTLQVISLILHRLQETRGSKPSTTSSPTLVVAPLTVMGNWRDQFEQHVQKDFPIKILTYHGTNRVALPAKEFNQYDVVITTYGMLATEFIPRDSVTDKAETHKTGLFAPEWKRVVLDEGHNIRNPRTKGALAACDLRAQSRWILTGTPIINSLKDLYSLVKFIGLTGGLEQLEVFNKILIRGTKNGDPSATFLLQALMATLCLRRRKDMAFVDLKIPELTEYIHRIDFTPSESKKYEALTQEAKGLLRTYETKQQSGDGRKAQDTYRHLLEVLLRLRQVCNHWRLCPERVTSLMASLETNSTVDLTPENMATLQQLLSLSLESRDECPVCMDDLTSHDAVITTCAHVFGRDCISRVIDTQHKCPICRAELADTNVLVSPAAGLGEAGPGETDADDLGNDEHTSSKVNALLSILRASHKDPGTKVVVFSQWCRFLDIIQPRLESEGFAYTRLDGTMTAPARDAALRAFATDTTTTVMLASLGVCSVGLNLTSASTVVLCDTWWAPAIEDQAVDRVHRLGQTRPCTVWRLVMKDSIEERTLDIQSEKRKLMATAFQEKEAARRGRTGRLGDIQRLLA